MYTDHWYYGIRGWSDVEAGGILTLVFFMMNLWFPGEMSNENWIYESWT
jgi:hypothetical protein